MDKFKRRISAPNLTVPKQITKPSMGRRQSDGSVEVQRLFPTMPKYYMRSIDRETAERLLMSKPAGTFLVRDRQSSNIPGLYTLSMRDKTNQCRHFKIDSDPKSRKLSIHGYRNQFESLEILVEFFVDVQRKEIKMAPFGQDAVYEEMNDDISSYQDMEQRSVNPDIPKSPVRGNATPSGLRQVDYENMRGKHVTSDNPHTQHSYENMDKKGGLRRPPPPSLQHSELQSPNEMLDTLLHNKDTNCSLYENIQPKNESPPLPPSRHPSMLGAINRQGSLPTEYENVMARNTKSPPPLPTRPHLNSSYQNLPGQGTNNRKPRPYHRSLTHS